MAHHHHSHAADISPAEADRIKSFVSAEKGARGDAWSAQAEQILSELAFYSQQVRSKTGLWSMGELDRFVTDYLPDHVGSPELTKLAPELIMLFAQWLKTSGQVPACDVRAIEKRMNKVQTR
jgi:hypothetical protein